MDARVNTRILTTPEKWASHFTGQAGIQSISKVNPPKFGGGLKFEFDPSEIGFALHGAGIEIGQKRIIVKGLKSITAPGGEVLSPAVDFIP
jgi:hypothetical protein